MTEPRTDPDEPTTPPAPDAPDDDADQDVKNDPVPADDDGSTPPER
jgi:hypothetical protein